MAVISMFYGIIVSMYYFDDRRHHLPHIHIRCQGDEAVFSIPEGELWKEQLREISKSYFKRGLKFIKMS
ncbi:MAG: DUF4160 domain-containing protein [Caldilineaceae bacterium]|nr:DUF4160 domain-containing protein [Caldilineaceae bacterium]